MAVSFGTWMSLAAELIDALRGAVVDLGSPQRVALPYSSLGITSAWAASLKSFVGRKGFNFLKVFI